MCWSGLLVALLGGPRWTGVLQTRLRLAVGLIVLDSHRLPLPLSR
jgi:hypothetical protein